MKRFSIIGCIVLSACAYVDTGQIDYRIAEPPRISDRQACSTNPSTNCDPILPARVDRRYIGDASEQGRPFTPREVYSIEIEQGVIGSNILEGNILGRQFGHTGEFAVLANVFEFASEADQAAQRRFLNSGEYSGTGDDPSDVELKLIYYSDDVQRSQPFNFSNIPLRPRTVYNGGSIGIQVVIIETDVQAGPVASMLTTLARFGQQAVPGPSELTDALFDLGESLFSGTGSDDRLFEYRFVLSAPTDERDPVQATFAPGRYVVRRQQDRRVPINWNNVRLDHNTARLFLVSADGTPPAELRNELYLVLNIRRFPENTAPEYYAQQDWSSFRNLLQQAANTQAAPLNSLTQSLQSALSDRRSIEWRARLDSKWSAVARAFQAHAASTVTNIGSLNLAACPSARTDLLRAQQLSERAMRDATRRFTEDYAAALTPTGTPATVEFKAGDHEALVSRISRLFIPWDPADVSNPPNFANAGAFETAYKTNPTTLADLAVATAQRRGREATACADLLQGVPRM